MFVTETTQISFRPDEQDFTVKFQSENPDFWMMSATTLGIVYRRDIRYEMALEPNKEEP